MKRKLIIFTGLILLFFIHTHAWSTESKVLNLTEYRDEQSLEKHRGDLSTIELSGKVTRAAYGDYHAIVPGVNIWIAEYPESKELKILSDKTGWWSMTVIKPKGVELGFSFVYEKKGWITTKSNVIPVVDEDDLDLSMQYIDPLLYHEFAKPGIEKMIASMIPAGEDTAFKNAAVVTIGKEWASMHDDRLPHGVAGAVATNIPGAIGPIYFDESVMPNLSYSESSVDGGVAWINIPPGEYILTATRPGLKFNHVKFVIKDTDQDDGIILYIASPPDTILSDDNTNP
jgi:hypothetical protein